MAANSKILYYNKNKTRNKLLAANLIFLILLKNLLRTKGFGRLYFMYRTTTLLKLIS